MIAELIFDIKYLPICLAQLWIYDTSSKRLLNKAFTWQNQTNHAWNLPIEGEEGYIEEDTTSLVLGIDSQAPWKPKLVTKNATNRQQKWIRERHNDNYFTLKNAETGNFLTAKSSFKTKVLGNQKFSLVFLKAFFK